MWLPRWLVVANVVGGCQGGGGTAITSDEAGPCCSKRKGVAEQQSSTPSPSSGTKRSIFAHVENDHFKRKTPARVANLFVFFVV
jgi:hypothetical protein